MADWALLFVEGCVLLALALLVVNPIGFTLTLMILLGLDALWGIFVSRLADPTKRSTGAELKWAWINLLAAGALLIVWLAAALPAEAIPLVASWIWLVVAAIAVIRTIIDYRTNWLFYYPTKEFGSDAAVP